MSDAKKIIGVTVGTPLNPKKISGENPYLGTLLVSLSIPAGTAKGTTFDLGITMGDLRRYKEIYVRWTNAANSGGLSNCYLALNDGYYPILRFGAVGIAFLLIRGDFENPDLITLYQGAGNPSTASDPTMNGAFGSPQQMSAMQRVAGRIDCRNYPNNVVHLALGSPDTTVAATFKIWGLKEI